MSTTPLTDQQAEFIAYAFEISTEERSTVLFHELIKAHQEDRDACEYYAAYMGVQPTVRPDVDVMNKLTRLQDNKAILKSHNSGRIAKLDAAVRAQQLTDAQADLLDSILLGAVKADVVAYGQQVDVVDQVTRCYTRSTDMRFYDALLRVFTVLADEHQKTALIDGRLDDLLSSDYDEQSVYMRLMRALQPDRPNEQLEQQMRIYDNDKHREVLQRMPPPPSESQPDTQLEPTLTA